MATLPSFSGISYRPSTTGNYWNEDATIPLTKYEFVVWWWFGSARNKALGTPDIGHKKTMHRLRE
jgi:hypothetical protein